VRAQRSPRSLLAMSTHDTKRSADVRARLDVLSEIPDEWAAAVTRWRRWNARHRTRAGRRTLPDANTEWLLYQTLVGIWPTRPPGREERAALRERMRVVMEKSAREAKRETSWIRPDPRYEQALERFVCGVLDDRGHGDRFARDLTRLAARIAPAGCWNALAGALLQHTAPGTPDLYQGDEAWSLQLVDPDNRAVVDHAALGRRLSALRVAMRQPARERARLLARWCEDPGDPGLKLHVVHCALAARRAHPALFAQGSHRALRAYGAAAGHVVAFLREHRQDSVLVIVPRLPFLLAAAVDAPAAPEPPGLQERAEGAPRAPVGAAVWGDTRVRLPRALAGRRLRGAAGGQTDEQHQAQGSRPQHNGVFRVERPEVYSSSALSRRAHCPPWTERVTALRVTGRDSLPVATSSRSPAGALSRTWSARRHPPR